MTGEPFECLPITVATIVEMYSLASSLQGKQDHVACSVQGKGSTKYKRVAGYPSHHNGQMRMVPEQGTLRSGILQIIHRF
eukprot:8910187-Pyramimonas_sp.AAC.1